MKFLLPLFVLSSVACAADNQVPSCTLDCKNEGKCRSGQGEFGYAGELDEEDPNAFQPGADAMHCECPTGYAGLRCEIQLVMCSHSEDTCSNGAPCTRAQDDIGGIFYHCECNVEQSDLSSAFALRFCQHSAIVFCSKDAVPGSSGHTFCTNGGRCNEIVEVDQDHPGCDCGSSWEGSHCQFLRSDGILENDEMAEASSGGGKDNTAGLVFAGLACAALVGAGIVFGKRRWKKQKEQQQDALRLEMSQFDSRKAKQGESSSIYLT